MNKLSDYVTIIQGRELLLKEGVKNSSIIAKVVGVGEVNSGTGTKGPWQKQIATLKDNSGTQQLILWNDDIGKLDQGQILKFEKPFWTKYKDEPQLSLGNYCKLHLANQDDLLPQSETPEESATLETKPEPKTETKEIGDLEMKPRVDVSIELILKLRKQVTAKVKEYEVDPHPGMIWEITALLYKEYFGDKRD